MGYNVDQAADEMKKEAEERAKLAKGVDEQLKAQIEGNKIVETSTTTKQTKEEQEALLNKLNFYASKDAHEITAAGIDFSKPLDQ